MTVSSPQPPQPSPQPFLDDNHIPVIDLSQDADETQIVSQLLDAFTTIGFATLVGHGVDAVQMEKAFAASKSFFSLPLDVKQQSKFKGHASNRGYLSVGSETHDNTVGEKKGGTAAADFKETFDIGLDTEPGFTNCWPSELEQTSTFKQDLLEYFNAMDALHLRLLRWIAIGLGLPSEDFLVQKCNAQHENLRLLHYPATTTSNNNKIRGNVHTDFGTLTLLVQDQVGGLMVQRLAAATAADGTTSSGPTWISVTPVPNAIVVNVGDMLMRWTNDKLKATLHQVVVVPAADASTTTTSSDMQVVPERYSIAFFCNANKDTMIECLESCCSTSTSSNNPQVQVKASPRYPPVNAHDYLTQRLTDTIPK
jgi:isopenicillin N synthase-like dioxygenase